VTLIFYKLCAGLLIFLASLGTVIYPLRKKTTPQVGEPAELGEAFASGIFLGAAFFHMLPDALRLFREVGAPAYPIPEVMCVFGFLFLLFLERLSLANTAIRSKHSIPYILAVILVVHAVVEGAALGMGVTLSETLMLFIAIMAHKGSESFALCVALLRHQLPFKRVLGIVIFFALMTPVGIGLGAFLNSLAVGIEGKLLAGLFNAFAAGTFLYISTLHHAHFHRHADEAQGMLEFGCLVLGAAVMAGIAVYA
jgi:zinc transporter 1/2/3